MSSCRPKKKKRKTETVRNTTTTDEEDTRERDTNWIEKRENALVLMFWYLTRTRKVPPKKAQYAILLSRGLSKEQQDEVDKMVRTSGFRCVASSVLG